MKMQHATGALCLFILISAGWAWTVQSEQSQVGPLQISTNGRSTTWLSSPRNSSVARLNATPGGCQVQVQSLVLGGQVTWSSPCKLTADPNNLTCSLVLTEDGDFQLLVLDEMTWNTNTSGRGVTSMGLLDSTGELVLVDAGNVTVWKSSEVQSSPPCQRQTSPLKLAMEEVAQLRSRRPRPNNRNDTSSSGAFVHVPSNVGIGLVLALSALVF